MSLTFKDCNLLALKNAPAPSASPADRKDISMTICLIAQGRGFANCLECPHKERERGPKESL